MFYICKLTRLFVGIYFNKDYYYYLLTLQLIMAPNIDETHQCISNTNLDLSCLTDTWFKITYQILCSSSLGTI